MKASKIDIKDWIAQAFNTSVLQKSRLQWVDYLKGIAILLVVYRHVLIGITRAGLFIPAYLVNANMIFYSFRMPLFFILSGIFLSGSLSRRSLKQFVFIKFENLFYPYLVWVFIQITLQIFLSHYTNSNRGLIDYTYILYQPRNLDQFWYLPALFNTTIIYALVKTKLKPPAIIQVALGFGLYFLSPYVQGISMLSDWMQFYLFFAVGDACSEYFFKESFQRFLKNKFTLLLVAPVFAFTQVYYLHHNVGMAMFLLIAFIGCFSMLVLSFRLQSLNILSFLRVIGYHSLYIYVIHVIIVGLIRIVLMKYFGVHNVEVLLVLCIAFGVTIPVVIYNMFIYNKPGWFLFSLQKEKKQSVQTKDITTVSPVPVVKV
ncbi:MAG TPA: acyltransferase family protein [Flavipsychrobacter sp.]|nr:acyltransferase family protein [Flavipsychrobacter sp.]